MDPNPILFRDLTYIFLAAVLGGLVAWKLRLPLILGFILGGVAISPFTAGPKLSDIHAFEVFAEVGVVLLMFSIGVEFSIPDLMRVKWVALLGGPLGILAIVAISAGVAPLVGWSITQGVVIGATISVASTMVLARLLGDSGTLNTTHGRIMIGITLVEDVAVICMTVVLPVFATSGQNPFVAAAWILGKAILFLIPLVYVAVKIIPNVFQRTKRTDDPELFLLMAIAICLGTAELAHLAGFSVALGAFLAGLSISGSHDLHDAHSQLVPLRDAFVALFFVSLGTLIDPKVLRGNLPLLGILLVLIVAAKFVVWGSVVWLFRYPFKAAVAVAAGLTQIGELSFVVVQVARSAGMVGADVFSTTIAASLFSILLNVFIVRVTFRWMGMPKASPSQEAAAS